jgi:hypothetical protein
MRAKFNPLFYIIFFTFTLASKNRRLGKTRLQVPTRRGKGIISIPYRRAVIF